MRKHPIPFGFAWFQRLLDELGSGYWIEVMTRPKLELHHKCNGVFAEGTCTCEISDLDFRKKREDNNVLSWKVKHTDSHGAEYPILTKIGVPPEMRDFAWIKEGDRIRRRQLQAKRIQEMQQRIKDKELKEQATKHVEHVEMAKWMRKGVAQEVDRSFGSGLAHLGR